MKNLLVFDLGGTSIKYALITKNGEILKKGITSTPKKSFTSLCEVLKSIYFNFKEQNIYGIAFSSPGAVNNSTGVISGVSAIPYIHNFEIKQEFEKIFNLPVVMENDGNCAALAEYWKGSGKNSNIMASIVLGSGVGGAIVIEGELLNGRTSQTGEFGYMLLEQGKTWSSLCSTTSFVQQIREITNDFTLTGEDIFSENLDLEIAKNSSLKNVLEKYYFNMFKGIYSIQCSFDTDSIIIGGGISSNTIFFNKLLEYLEKFYNELDIKVSKPNVKKALFENDANLLGAAYNFILKNKSF